METAEQAETTHVMHFQIEGEFLTGLARDFVQEGNWRKAFNFLMENLHGMDAQIAMDIVQGKKQLTGVNDLQLEDDNREAEVKGWLDWQFRYCFAFEGRVFRPYGFVSSLRREDWHLARRIVAHEDEDMLDNALWHKAMDRLSESSGVPGFNPWSHYENELKYRPAYYARRRDRDLCVNVRLTPALHQSVMFEEVRQDVPLWYQLPTSAADVARAAYAAQALVDLSEEFFPSEEEQDGEPPTPAEPVTLAPERSATDIQAQLEQDEREAEAEDRAAALRIEVLHAQIAHQADHDTEYGWLQLKAFDAKAGRNVELKVPHRAFICAALGRAKAYHLMPDYDARCPSGLKMYNDDRWHSDAWIGAGLQPEDAYDDEIPEQRLFMEELYNLQRKLLSCSFDILARGKASVVWGEVTHDPAEASKDKILVLANAAPEFAPAAMQAKAVIVETGSKLAHLVVVSREESVPVIRVAGACERFKSGRKVSIDFDEGTVEMWGI